MCGQQSDNIVCGLNLHGIDCIMNLIVEKLTIVFYEMDGLPVEDTEPDSRI